MERLLEDLMVENPTLDDDDVRTRWAAEGHPEELTAERIAEARGRLARHTTKNAFVHRYVAARPEARGDEVRTAWAQAGGSGWIEDTQVSRARRELGFPPLRSGARDLKTSFIRDYLAKHPKANVGEVTTAFREQNPGAKLSQMLIYKVKRQIKNAKSSPVHAAPPPPPRAASAVLYESVERLLDQAISLCDRCGDEAVASEIRKARRIVSGKILTAK